MSRILNTAFSPFYDAMLDLVYLDYKTDEDFIPQLTGNVENFLSFAEEFIRVIKEFILPKAEQFAQEALKKVALSRKHRIPPELRS